MTGRIRGPSNRRRSSSKPFDEIGLALLHVVHQGGPCDVHTARLGDFPVTGGSGEARATKGRRLRIS